jgi:hypothetical protein
MNGSLLAELDRICSQFALALHNSELQVYATLTFLLLLGIVLFPPRNDPGQTWQSTRGTALVVASLLLGN